MNLNAKERFIEIETQDGPKQGKILFTFEANGDNFVLYELEQQVFAAKIDQNYKLYPLATDEWKLVEKIYEQFKKDYEQGESEDVT